MSQDQRVLGRMSIIAPPHPDRHKAKRLIQALPCQITRPHLQPHGRGTLEAKLLKHLELLYSRAYLRQLKSELAAMHTQGLDEHYEKTIRGFLDRFCSLKHFMKELKERFSRWFNKRHARRGTLWQERYKSILVRNGEALATMA